MITLPIKCTHCGEMITKHGNQRDGLLMGTVDGEKKPFHRGCFYSKLFKGKPRPWQEGDKNPAKRPEVRVKISENNPMKRPEVRAKFIGDNNPAKRPEVRAKISENNPMKRPEIAAKMSKLMKGRHAPWMMGDKNVMHRPEVKAKFMGDKNPMRNPKNFKIWQKAMGKTPNKPETRLIPILDEFGFIYHKRIEIRRAPDFVHERERLIIEYDGFAGHNPGSCYTLGTWKECLAIDGIRDLDYLDADYEVLRIFPEDLAEGDDFVRYKVEEWMLKEAT